MVAEFPFKNETTEPVLIKEMKSSCGCSTPAVKSQTIPAGGQGVLKVAYAPENRLGVQNIQVIVRTDEPKAGAALLNLRVNIQPAVSATPRLVQWAKGDGAISRVIDIKQLGKAAVRLAEPMLHDDSLNAELKPGAEAGTWQLKLTPKSVETSFTTKVEIPVVVGERTLTYSVFTVVR